MAAGHLRERLGILHPVARVKRFFLSLRIRAGAGGPRTVFSLIYLLLYVAGVVAFAVFVSRQEDSTSKTRIWIWVLALVALLLALSSLLIGGAVMIAACFYVADRKKRSRMWAILGLFFGPVALLVLVSLSKLNAGDSLSLYLTAAAGADSGSKREQ